MKMTLVSILAVVLLSGCAHVFSEQASRLVDPSLTFEQIRKDPKARGGKFAKLGGIIVATRNTAEGSQVEVVQFRLGSDDMPDESSPSGGRFLAVTPDYLDNMVYKAGRAVAVIGEVKGEKTLPLDEISYRYPVLAIAEIHVWRTEDLYPRGYPYPSYYDPFFTPYWWYEPPYWRYPAPRPRHR